MRNVMQVLQEHPGILRGRIVQISGTAGLTLAIHLMASFQRSISPIAAYIGSRRVLPFPGDIEQAGVVLSQLMVVLSQHPHTHVVSAVDVLLRSQQIPVVCLDMVALSGEGSRGGPLLPPGVLARYMHQCRHSKTALIVLSGTLPVVLGPVVGVHLHTQIGHTVGHTAGGEDRLHVEVLRSRVSLHSGACDVVLPDRLC